MAGKIMSWLVQPVEGVAFYVGGSVFSTIIDWAITQLMIKVGGSITSQIGTFFVGLAFVTLETGIALWALRAFFMHAYPASQFGCVFITYLAVFMNLTELSAFTGSLDQWVTGKL